jgi:hypothetical protein
MTVDTCLWATIIGSMVGAAACCARLVWLIMKMDL